MRQPACSLSRVQGGKAWRQVTFTNLRGPTGYRDEIHPLNQQFLPRMVPAGRWARCAHNRKLGWGKVTLATRKTEICGLKKFKYYPVIRMQ